MKVKMTDSQIEVEIDNAANILMSGLSHVSPEIATVAMVGVLAAQGTLAGFEIENIIKALRSAWNDIDQDKIRIVK